MRMLFRLILISAIGFSCSTEEQKKNEPIETDKTPISCARLESSEIPSTKMSCAKKGINNDPQDIDINVELGVYLKQTCQFSIEQLLAYLCHEESK